MAEQVEAMQRELASAPVEVVVANHCYGLFELAAVYLSQVPPLLPQSRLAIDALACLVDGLKGRLGEAEGPLKDGLSQLQLAYVQIDGAQRAGAQVATSVGVNGASDTPTPTDSATGGPPTDTPAPDGPATGDPAPDTTSGTEAEPGE
jgi:hypothetical protein